MYPPVQFKCALARRFSCAIAICAFLFTANFVVSPAQAHTALASDALTPVISETDISLTRNVSDPDVAAPLDEEESIPSDPPATTEPNNSTGDEILLRPPR